VVVVFVRHEEKLLEEDLGKHSINTNKKQGDGFKIIHWLAWNQ
jgi:hypothetical protein